METNAGLFLVSFTAHSYTQNYSGSTSSASSTSVRIDLIKTQPPVFILWQLVMTPAENLEVDDHTTFVL